ncbi:TonB-dependent receptor [Gloeobacter kilaueensis]|uniref:TonB-dependent receptor n=1 Tax=Gloeobacter kilaueensis (strain ATCC BAA-2537 / CCAP 1431/1 / ULC 316 / JS1) TaxID=1183438 RepID=U5QJK1_GLOK1|nr:TonB-dependent receptor [Gloeobacter kilaueensis]AGY59063.1 TonB-dependent receptor [Gloeobacter kilaueensis JS1]
MSKNIQLMSCPGSVLAVAVLLAGSLSLVGAGRALAEPVVPDGYRLARSSEEATPHLRDLLREASGTGAADLQNIPSAWQWTQPLEPKLSQKRPADLPEPPAATAAGPDEDQSNFLDEVSVTATRRPTRARDSTQSVNIVKREDFQAQGAVTVSDALLLIPGFNNSTPALGGQSNLSANFLRGFPDTEYVVLRDGVRLGSPFNGRSDVSAIVLDDLERIEVITGGSTLRYGSGSVGGVINLITETPKGRPRLTVSYEYGSYSFNRTVAKFSGGDDIFAYNLIFTGIAAQNNYPFGFTLPRTPQFYGPNDVARNPGCNSDNAADFDAFGTCLNGGFPDGTSLYGYLKPEVGPPLKVQGINNESHVGNDNYMAKLIYKPTTNNKLSFRFNQHNLLIDDRSPGYFDYNACGIIAGPTATKNGTYNFDRFLPVDISGREQRCPLQTYLPVTASSTLALPYSYSNSYNGRISFKPGFSYPSAEQAQGEDAFFRQRSSSESEFTFSWDWDINSSQSLNTYFLYYRQALHFYRDPLYFYNSDLLGGIAANGSTASGAGELLIGANLLRPYVVGQRYEVQSSYNVQLSPGQILSAGVNYVQDKLDYQENVRGDNNELLSYFNKGFSTSRLSVFVVDDIIFSKLLTTNVGLRYTNSDQFGSILTPAAGVRVNLSDNLSLRGNYSQVFNSASLLNLYVTTGTYGQNTGLPNPSLKPETGITYDIGVDWSPARNLAFKLTYFDTYVDNKFNNQTFFNPNFAPGNGEPVTISQTINLGSYRGSGIEFSGDWQFADQWRLRVVWTNVDARPYGNYSDDIDSVTYPNYKEFQDYNLPFNSVIAALTYTNKGLSATLLGRYDDGKYRFRGDNSSRVPSWLTLDLNLEIPITTAFTMTASVFNITDTQYEYLDANPAPGTTFRLGGRFTLGG